MGLVCTCTTAVMSEDISTILLYYLYHIELPMPLLHMFYKIFYLLLKISCLQVAKQKIIDVVICTWWWSLEMPQVVKLYTNSGNVCVYMKHKINFKPRLFGAVYFFTVLGKLTGLSLNIPHCTLANYRSMYTKFHFITTCVHSSVAFTGSLNIRL